MNRDVIHHHRWMAHHPEPTSELGWTAVFALVLAAILTVLCVVGVLAIGGPA